MALRVSSRPSPFPTLLQRVSAQGKAHQPLLLRRRFRAICLGTGAPEPNRPAGSPRPLFYPEASCLLCPFSCVLGISSSMRTR